MDTITKTVDECGLEAVRNFKDFTGKILVVGYSGGGKSTLANALGSSLGVRVIHIDEELWSLRLLPAVEYKRREHDLLWDWTHSSEPLIIEGVQLLRLFDVTQLPVIVLRTNPFRAAWRQSKCGAARNRVWPLALIGAVRRNYFRYKPLIDNLMKQAEISDVGIVKFINIFN